MTPQHAGNANVISSLKEEQCEEAMDGHVRKDVRGSGKGTYRLTARKMGVFVGLCVTVRPYVTPLGILWCKHERD